MVQAELQAQLVQAEQKELEAQLVLREPKAQQEKLGQLVILVPEANMVQMVREEKLARKV
jgi:hypothetical protein